MKTELSKPDEILRWMGGEFVRLRQHHPRKAWTFYRDALMQYQAQLREVISLENIIERAMRIETFVQSLREIVEKHELTPSEALEGMRGILHGKAHGRMGGKNRANGEEETEV